MHARWCWSGGKGTSVGLCGAAFVCSQCGCTCCFGKRMMDPRSGWTLFPWTDSAQCVCVYVCLGWRLKGIREQASHRSISFLLWRSGDLRCMASCDPDSFLLSPSAPPHWHSGITSEGVRDESKKEKQTEWVRQDGEGVCWIGTGNEKERKQRKMEVQGWL